MDLDKKKKNTGERNNFGRFLLGTKKKRKYEPTVISFIYNSMHANFNPVSVEITFLTSLISV